MYQNLKEIWAGIIKASVQLTGGWMSSTLALVANLTFNVLPTLFFIWAILVGQWMIVIAMGTVVIAQLLYEALVRVSDFRVPPWSAVTHSLGSFLVSLMLADGMLRLTLGRQITWKDRPVIGAPQLPATHLKLWRKHQG